MSIATPHEYKSGMAKNKNVRLVAVGQQIRKVRLEKGYSQEDFAAFVGLDRAYYGGVERGERNLSLLNLVRIAIALKVEVGELFPARSELEKLGNE